MHFDGELAACPKCGSDEQICGVEYAYDDPEHYDGISEFHCMKCNARWGRWTGKILNEGEYERKGGRFEALRRRRRT